MATELEMHFAGSVPGLNEHRLSLGAFGKSLILLVASLRRIATNMLGDAIGGGADTGRGRLRTAARQLDVQLSQVTESSSGLLTTVALNIPVGQQMPIFEDLPNRTVMEFLDCVQNESHGRLRNASVRKYLRSLPDGVQHQSYTFRDAVGTRTVDVGDMILASVPEIPHLVQAEGSIVGVGFEPGKAEVKLRMQEAQMTMLATPTQVETALELRRDPVRALAIAGAKLRLLRLQSASEPAFKPTPEDVENHVFRRWGAVLQRLAE